MVKSNAPPKEGDLYKRINIGQHTFELRYGYYTESDRAFGEPAVIFPELSVYTEEGYRIVTAVQEVCEFYKTSGRKAKDESCVGCIYYSPPGDDIGICKCTHNMERNDDKGGITWAF